jgi:glycosyltransferase involved in cell wall biosynthesis
MALSLALAPRYGLEIGHSSGGPNVLLIIQMPCLNEETTLAATVADLPRSIPGVDRIEYLIIDDGSTDRTIEVARDLGIHHIVQFPANRGLAAAFRAGIDACLRLGADIIVNTDGDNQYRGEFIPSLVDPVIRKEADVVVGDRDAGNVAEFSWVKQRLQNLGSATVRMFSGTTVADATSGFRAYSREAAMRLNLVNNYTYTLETIIQAGHGGLTLASVPIKTNRKTRESRLMKSIRSYVQRSAVTILRSYVLYRPFKSFLLLGSAVFSVGVALGIRFLYFYALGLGGGKIQSVVLAGVLLIIGVQLFITGLLADIVAANRKLMEDALVRLRVIQSSIPMGASDGNYASLNPRGQALRDPETAPSASREPLRESV